MKKRIILGPLTMFAVAFLLAIASAPYAKRYVETRQCGRHLAAISQAARVWAEAHNGRLPSGFVIMSNELVSTHFLLCPGDKLRDPADNWQAFNSANSSYQIWEGASAAKDLPLELLQNMRYLQCKVHFGNYANALGNVAVYRPPTPLTIRFLAGLAIVAFLGGCLWQRYEPVRGEPPIGTTTGDILPRIERVRHDYLATREIAATRWYRKRLLAAARHALRALAFFADRKSDPQAPEARGIRQTTQG